MEKLSEIWVVNESGIPLFNKSRDAKVDATLFGGFLSAIQSFVKDTFYGTKIEKLILGESKLSVLNVEDYHIYIVIRCHKKVKDNEIADHLQKIKELFISNFKTKLNKEVNDISEFLSFDKILEEFFVESKVLKRMTSWFDEV
ncbi:MAG TPA: hypothetical protein VMV49_07145 [Candidatus Deferrimicrobium sp.]|nr:hypothetical protein [Candidatus Deferrimicrobium sp.]